MKRTFGFTPIGFGRNVIIFIVDISSSAHIDYNKKRSYARIGIYTNCRKIVFN